MVWVQLFPLGTTFINQSVTQFQDNWLFLQTNINKDHFFNTGAPDEGHHKFVNLLSAGDAALAAGMSGVLYSKGTGGSGTINQPFWRNANAAGAIQQIPTLLTGTTIAIGAGAQTTTVLDFNIGPQPNCHGIFEVFVQGSTNSMAVGYYTWNGTNCYVLQLGRSNLITSVSNGVTNILVSTNLAAPGVVQYAVYTLPI